MPPRDTPPERNTREGIVSAALRLLEEGGLPDLSMRRLAATLGVQPSALYWHVENKQSLLAEVADRIVAAAPVPALTGERDADVSAVASALRDALLAHRDGAEVVLSTQALGLGSGAARAAIADALGADDPRGSAATVLLQYILGHASVVQQRIQAARFGAYPQDEADVVAETSADFATGIRIILAGLDA